jgi:glycerol-3-phosphate acyltransferase PlsY
MAVSLNSIYVVVSLAAGYLLGSIPFGLILTQIFGAGDLRKIGSGNIGATNVLRTGRRDLAAATLVLDALKATVAYLLAALMFHDETAALAAAAGAFFGHLYPVWLGFRGGKGVATFLGGLIGAAWPAAIVFAIVWLATAYLSRYSSLSALIASVAAPVSAIWLASAQVAAVFGLLAAILWVRHAENIRRLASGSESRIGAKG